MTVSVLGAAVLIASGQARGRTSVEQKVGEIVRSFRGVMGVAAIDLRSGETVAVNADTRFPTASTIKTAVMVEAYQQAADGRLPLTTAISLKDSEKVGGSGVLNGMHEGLSLTVADLIHLMIVLSDNTATNLLMGGSARRGSTSGSKPMASARPSCFVRLSVTAARTCSPSSNASSASA
jgi:beta-lactamase class A